MIATYHNHSTWSDGSSSIGELVDRARELGVDELGISDHYVLHPDGRVPRWAMPADRLHDYVEEVRSFQGATGPVVRLGLEADWFPGHGDALREALAPYPFDYLIGSVHEVNGFRVDAGPRTWDTISQDEQNEKHRQYWQHLRSLARSGLFDVAAHIDLTKKYGHQPTTDLSEVIGETLDAIAETGMVVELNTAGWHKPCQDGYPTLDLLRECHRRGIPVTLSSDAHEPEHLLRDFPRGAQRLMKAGYEQIARFAGRDRTFEHIEAGIARF